ncbi:MAG: translocation/assembly module TamB domain-containing protein [Bacteroidota bacterium]
MALILLGLAFYFAVQSFGFQTWLAHRVSGYLSSQLNTEIKIDKIAIQFFKKADMKGLLIKDQKGDTLFAGDIGINVHTFDYKKQKLYLNDIHLMNVQSKIILAKNDSNFNFQFIADYFKPKNNTNEKSANWTFRIKKITLSNVRFVYKNLNNNIALPNNINYNDIDISSVNGQILYPIIDRDKFIFEIKKLSLKEKSGFTLKELSAGIHLSPRLLQADNLRLITEKTKLKANVYFNYGAWQDYTDFVNKVHFVSKFEDSTKLNFGDIAYFAPALNHFKEEIDFTGNISGTVSDINLEKFKLKYRNFTQFKGNLSLSGLPDLSNSFLHFDAKVLSTNYKDLVQIPLSSNNQTSYLSIPESLKKLGTTSYKGKFDGLLNDFTTYGVFTSDLGIIDSKLSIQLGDKAGDIHYKGKISSEHFDLGKLLGLNDFNAISMDFELNGIGLDLKNINSEAKGKIDNIQIQGYNYGKIKLNGTLNEKVFNGNFSCLDTNANFDFNGSVNFNRAVPEMYFISSINRLNLNKLHLTSLVDSGEFSSQLFINISGDNIDKLSGQINFDNSVYKTKTRTYKLNRFNLELNQSTDNKSITLKSAYFNAKINGQYKLGHFGKAAQNILSQYYPSYFKAEKPNKMIDDQFSFDINIKDFQTIHDLLLPDLMLSKGSIVNGDFNALNQKLNLNFKTSLLNYQLFDIRQLNLKLNQVDNAVICDLGAESIKVGDSLGIEQFMLNIKSLDQFLAYQLNWDNHRLPLSNGLLKGRIIFDKLKTALYNDSLRICINDSIWKQENLSAFNFNEIGMVIQNIQVSHNNQLIAVNGEFSNKEDDSLQFKVNHINLSQFNPILKLFHAKAEGEMNGYLYLSQPNDHFAIDGNVNLQRLKMNDNLVGELSLSSTYNTKNNFLNLHGFTSLGLQDEFGNQIKNIAFNGNYFLDNRAECLDIDLIANPANIKLLNPILTNILTIKNGYLSGKIKIHGSPQKPLFDGKLRLFNTELKVDYTNAIYNVSGDIEVMPDQIRFSDLLLREKGTKAAAQGTVNGNIFHTNFKKIQLDYDINYKNMLVLNTTEKENTFYYGRIYSSGRAGIYGYLNNISMQIFDTITKNSRFVMQLDGPNEIEDDDFVHFVKKDTSKVKKELDFTGFNLDLSINATPNASVQIILDKQNGDMLNAQGQGNINLKINTLGKFEMTGDYLITNGDYLFTLEHVINKKFDIEAGSSISWDGDPLNADINVSTSYKQRASVAVLLNDTTGVYKSRYAVDCKLLLSGKLFSPNISFAFDFPNIDATAKSRINNVLSDEGELNRQVFSFLLFRNFVTPQMFNTNGGGVIVGNAAASTSSELLSNRISGFLNSYFGGLPGLRDLQLGLNYRPGSQNTKESVDLALSKQFLNNKVSVDGNFGMNNSQAGNSGNFIGDVTIDYKLTDDGRYKLTGFNRTNSTAQIATAGGPYTQGFGFFYRREFNSLRDFMNRNKMK